MSDLLRGKSTLVTYRTGRDFLRSLPDFQQDHAHAIYNAVYQAAIGMTDDEVQAVVLDALGRARRALSS